MNVRESIEEMTALLTDEGLIYLKTCERCGEAFSSPISDDRVCATCAGLHRIASAAEVGGDG